MRSSTIVAILTTIAMILICSVHAEETNPKLEMIKKLTTASLSYLSKVQQKETIGIKRFKGDWESHIRLDWTFAFLGYRKKEAYDSNNFTTTTIYNILAPMLLAYPEYQQEIIPMLNLAISNIQLYENKKEHTFGFWQFFPRREHTLNEKEKADAIAGNPPLIRRTNNFWYYFDRINYAENVPDDSDDTATAYTAFRYHQLLSERFDTIESYQPVVSKIGPLFDAFRDKDRGIGRNFFNYPSRGLHDSGAFLTWFKNDKDFHIHDIFPHKNEVFLPFGFNDVDCVVNANILRSLAINEELSSTLGTEESCEYLRRMIHEKKYTTCGIYYPNPNTFFYTTSKAYERGATCLEPALDEMIQDIKKRQNKTNGSWHSYRRWRGDRDRINSTAYAVTALSTLYLSTPLKHRNQEMLESIEKGINYLIKHALWDKKRKTVHWRRGVSFTGGTVVRLAVVWTSEPQTTALALDALTQYRKILEEGDNI